MPSASCCLAIRCNGHHGLDHDVRIDSAFRQSQLPAAKLLEIELPQTLRTSEISLRIVGDAVSGEEIAEVEPKAQLRIMRVTILETFDVANGSRFLKTIFKLRHPNLDRSKTVVGRNLSRGPHRKEAPPRGCDKEEC